MNNWNTKPDCWEKATTYESRKLMTNAMLEAMFRDRRFSMVRTITGHALIPPIRMKWLPPVRLVVDNTLRPPPAWLCAIVDEEAPQP